MLIQIPAAEGTAEALVARPSTGEGPFPGVILYMDAFGLRPRIEVRTATAHPEVVAACGGFHGGGLATDEPDSPHRGLSKATAEFVFGHADHDQSMGPGAVARLGEALKAAGLKASNEVYHGASHGYSMADTSAFHEEATERHFRELRALLGRTLKG